MNNQMPIDPKAIDSVARSFVSGLSFLQKSRFNGRLERGLEIAKTPGAVLPFPSPDHPRRFSIKSSDGFKSYIVDLDAKSCECPDSQKGNHCKHRIAAYYFELATPKQTVQPPAPKPVSKPESKPDPKPQPASSNVNVDRILAELGFAPEPKVDKESQPTGLRLGTLYQRYLHGADLQGKSYRVTIASLTKETVTPHPSLPAQDKYCLWVKGLPEGLPGGILFGSRGEQDLVAIFGKVDITAIQGKPIIVTPETLEVAGRKRDCIRFRWAA